MPRWAMLAPRSGATGIDQPAHERGEVHRQGDRRAADHRRRQPASSSRSPIPSPSIPLRARRRRLFREYDRLDAPPSGVEGSQAWACRSPERFALVRMGGRGSAPSNENPGGGSVFWVELPTTKTASTMVPAKPVPVPPAAAERAAPAYPACRRPRRHPVGDRGFPAVGRSRRD